MIKQTTTPWRGLELDGKHHAIHVHDTMLVGYPFFQFTCTCVWYVYVCLYVAGIVAFLVLGRTHPWHPG